MPRPRLVDRGVPGASTGLVALLLVLASGGMGAVSARTPGTLSSAPQVPVGLDGGFLRNLTAPTFAGGSGSGSLTFEVGNPLGAALENVGVQFWVYGYVPRLGATAGAVPGGSVAVASGSYSGGSASWGSSAAFRFAPPDTVGPGASIAGSLPVEAMSGAPVGTYLIATSLTFELNGSPETFDSRGHFSNAEWENATLPNGSNGLPGLNLSRLGVAGVSPETSVSVLSNAPDLAIYGLGAAGIALIAVGAYGFWRRRERSSSGATDGPAPHSAPSALGKKRTNEGERTRS